MHARKTYALLVRQGMIAFRMGPKSPFSPRVFSQRKGVVEYFASLFVGKVDG
jgi:hypothetical protein